ncbi:MULTISPECIES: ABC transporter permease [Aminobacterium]|jgi:ABC-type lipoprotein release transport system permease subunit|uniref:ABC transporter permease n=1 Tax=Aminobacterium TaxID=81466 RepID=UPI00257B51BD|nr:FtsX-like permease family protein [Aminobacterium sp. UBA4987]
MLGAKLAFRNIKEAGLRTWLNVAVLALTFIVIVGFQGLYTGILAQSSRAMIEDEVAGGQYWQQNYDPYDVLSVEDGHGVVPDGLVRIIENKEATPILIRQATIYLLGRAQAAELRGIDPSQTILNIPSHSLYGQEGELPILTGRRMAKNKNLSIGDYVTIRWRDARGTFDAMEGKVVHIMDTKVPTIDSGVLWVPLDALRQMTVLEKEATIVVVSRDAGKIGTYPGWHFNTQAFLLRDLTEWIKSERISASIVYIILLFLGMLAIFDTQVLSIFRRKKEIGTLIALGMTRMQVVMLFTMEGVIQGVLAICVSLIFGMPLLSFLSEKGLSIPQIVEGYGFALSDKLYPIYSAELVLGTMLFLMVVVTIISFLPSSKIAKLQPTEALKGKIS